MSLQWYASRPVRSQVVVMSKPEFLGPYRLGETLGRGGMGSVFAGEHVKTGEKVAVKLIAAHVADDMKFRRRFDAEIETLKRLRHDNIVGLIGYGEQDGQLFYSMELVEGEPLQKRIRREKRLGWMITVDIAIQICAALKHAHDFGVIHRDLKPANLVLTAEEKVKLVDFGIAKIFGASEQTMAGSVLGTADYMAPEQALGEGITLRSDLYALGSVMYAMAAGRAPFKGKKITEVIASLKRDKPIPLEMIVPETPDDLVELIHHLLEKDPADRPPTALAVMNRLKAMRNGLLREQTIHQEADGTEIRPPKPSPQETMVVQDSSFDTSSHDSSGTSVSSIEITPTPSRNLPISNLPNGGGTVAANGPTIQSQPGGTPPQADGVPSNKTIRQASTSATDATLIASDSQHELDASSTQVERSTHFQTVDRVGGRGGFESERPSAGRLSQILSIAGMIGLLVLGGIAVVYAMRKPSAEQLYNEIIAISSTGDLTDARPQIDQFLKLYPDHENAGDVTSMDLSLQRDAVIRRLQLKAKLPGRTLDPHEQAFVDAMDLRKVDTLAAQTKMQQWLDVFVNATTRDDKSIQEIASLVQYERDRLGLQEPMTGNDRRNRELVSRIEAAAALEPQEREAMLQGIVELYRDSPWAGPAVELAREQLDPKQ